MWICDEEIGSCCEKGDGIILRSFRRDVADGQSGSLDQHDGEKDWWEEKRALLTRTVEWMADETRSRNVLEFSYLSRR